MQRFECLFFDPPEVELTDEREGHICARHPDLLPEFFDELKQTVEDPTDTMENPYNPDKWMLARWFPHVRGGKYVIVQVLTERQAVDRHWIVTAYLDSELPT